MKSKQTPHVLSIVAFGVFCFLAAGSMEDSPSTNPSANSPGPGHPANVGIALECVIASGGAPGQEKTYFYYGDALKEKFDLLPNDKMILRDELSLDDTFDSFYVYSCSDIDRSLGTKCTSLKLQRDTLGLEENRKYSDGLESMGDTGATFDCHRMDPSEAAKVLQRHNETVKRESDQAEQEKKEQLRRNQF